MVGAPAVFVRRGIFYVDKRGKIWYKENTKRSHFSEFLIDMGSAVRRYYVFFHFRKVVFYEKQRKILSHSRPA